ncbi:hypothetical protein B0H13DRAFT_1861784 [Mycena leptocephala]|nr:hypothetical protein B0H13DRAFT_1861784 [Mycena leptocephala]
MYSDLSWHGIYGSSSSFAVHALQGQKSLRESRLAQPAVLILSHDRHFEMTHDVKSFFLDVDSGRNPDEDPDNREIGQSEREFRTAQMGLLHPARRSYSSISSPDSIGILKTASNTDQMKPVTAQTVMERGGPGEEQGGKKCGKKRLEMCFSGFFFSKFLVPA